MKLTIIREAPWTVGDRIVNFRKGQVVEVGNDVTDDIAQQMLEHDYAIKTVVKSTLVTETKAETTEPRPERKKRGRKPKEHNK